MLDKNNKFNLYLGEAIYLGWVLNNNKACIEKEEAHLVWSHMMARFISNKTKTHLLRHSESAKGVIVCHRHQSSEATKAKWVEIDGVKLLEEHVQRVMVKKATPDWLPFLPGSSFWVPPPPSPFLHKFSIPSHPFFLQQGLSSFACLSQPHCLFVNKQFILYCSLLHVRRRIWECYCHPTRDRGYCATQGYDTR